MESSTSPKPVRKKAAPKKEGPRKRADLFSPFLTEIVSLVIQPTLISLLNTYPVRTYAEARTVLNKHLKAKWSLTTARRAMDLCGLSLVPSISLRISPDAVGGPAGPARSRASLPPAVSPPTILHSPSEEPLLFDNESGGRGIPRRPNDGVTNYDNGPAVVGDPEVVRFNLGRM